MHENVCYKKNYLKETILRVDFASPLIAQSKSLPEKVAVQALKHFPLFTPNTLKANEFMVNQSDMRIKQSEIQEYMYQSKDRSKTLKIQEGFALVTSKSYEKYGDFKGEFMDVYNAITSEAKELTARRIGVRFVNVVDAGEGNPLNWELYINKELLGGMGFYQGKADKTRAFHVLEFSKNELSVKLQAGIANPDHPAPIKRRQFILDIDAYFEGACEANDVSEIVDGCHESIQDVFEESITDNLRALMKPVV